MSDSTAPSDSTDDTEFLDDLDDLGAYDSEHEQPTIQQRLADASIAVIGGVVALIALVAGVIGFGIGTQVGDSSSAPLAVSDQGGSGDAASKLVPARVLGAVTKANGRMVTVADVTGSSRIVGIGPRASVFSATSSSPTIVRAGSRIMVVTSRPLQATKVIVAPVGKNVGAPVRSVESGAITFVGVDGKPKAVSTVGAQFLIARPASFEAVTVGKRIVAFGLRNTVGVVARTVVILP